MTRPDPDRNDLRARALLERAYRAAVDAARPERIVPRHLPEPEGRGAIVVVGAGKAAAAMAAATEAFYRDRGALERLRGRVVTRYGHGAPTERIAVAEASHPVPDAAGVDATRAILDELAGLGRDDTVVALISGGGSALLCAPQGIGLEEKRAVTDALLRSGADIGEMNAVRKHLSAVKGGRLALAAAPARVTALILSDVVGDDLSVIASGPTVGDASSYRDALAVLDRYRIDHPAARAALERGAAGELPETPDPDDPRLAGVRNVLIGSNQQSLDAAAALLERAGVPALVLASEITGEAREAGALHAAIATQLARTGQPAAPPLALLSGGETTVTVRAGPGEGARGGRNGEFALGFAVALPDPLPAGAPIYLLAADSDGIDGSEDNAGAFVTPALRQALPRREARALLDANRSYDAFAGSGHLLVTGPTRTNVNDLRIVLVGEPPEERGAGRGPD